MKSLRDFFRPKGEPNAFDAGNDRAFERDCAAEGIDPSFGTSPDLRRKLQLTDPESESPAVKREPGEAA